MVADAVSGYTTIAEVLYSKEYAFLISGYSEFIVFGLIRWSSSLDEKE